jgi:hypothetical protein
MIPGEMSSLGRKRAQLSAPLNKRLVAYAAAAGAAGVGVLGVQLSEAEVVYTPANLPILRNNPIPLDLNNDGITDFQLSNLYSFQGTATSCIDTCKVRAALQASPAQPGNAVWATSSAIVSHGQPARLTNKNDAEAKTEVALPAPWGIVVDEHRKFQAEKPGVMDFFRNTLGPYRIFTESDGAWGKGRQFAGSYLGLKFTINGEIHYGWARIVVHSDTFKITATLSGYAYETVANRGIITGVPRGTFDNGGQTGVGEATVSADVPAGSLGRLALGNAGVRPDLSEMPQP